MWTDADKYLRPGLVLLKYLPLEVSRHAIKKLKLDCWVLRGHMEGQPTGWGILNIAAPVAYPSDFNHMNNFGNNTWTQRPTHLSPAYQQIVKNNKSLLF